MRTRIYTFNGCTIEIPKGGRTATVKRPGEGARKFESLPNGPTAEVQAHRWIMGIEQPAPAKSDK